MVTQMTLNEIANKHHAWTAKWGWHTSTTHLEKVALIASEVGEAANELRGKEPTEEFGFELADIILRTVDLARCANIDIEKMIIDKMKKNELRDLSHRIK